jgi:hypothetical protein
MDTPSYQQAFQRIRAEYLEMPGMRLTPAEVQRLSGAEISICVQVLDDLVRAKFLHTGPDGSYVRGGDDSPARFRMARAESGTGPRSAALPRAG